MRAEPESFACRTATRPDSSKPPAGGAPCSGSAAQPPRTAAAATQSADRTTEGSVPQALDGGSERFVVGRFFGRIAPDALRLGALAQRPQHLAQMRGDLRVGARGVRPAQVRE